MKRWTKEIVGLVTGLALVAGGILAWNAWFGTGEGQGLTGEKLDRERAPRPDRTLECTGVTGTPAERVKACIADTSALSLSPEAKELVEELGQGGAILNLSRPFSAGAELREADAATLELLLGDDEEALAAALRDAGIRGLVVHRDMTQALDRDDLVISRLAHHDHLEWFQLRRVVDGGMIYSVRGSRADITAPTGAAMLAGLRARLEGRRPPPQPWKPKSVRLLASMRLQGSTLVLRHASGADLDRALDELAQKLITRWERDVATEGHGRLSERLDDVRLEIHVVLERAPVEPRSRWAIFDLWELGVDGAIIRRAKGLDDEKFTYMPGSEAIVRSIKSPDSFLRHAAEEFGWNARRPWEDPRVRFDLIRTAHFMERSAGGADGAVQLERGMPIARMADLSDDHIRDMLVDGGEWWLHNMRADGSINYKYWPTQNRLSTDYNEVRHILAARDLADTWRYRHDARYLKGSRQAMDWLMRYAVRGSDPAHDTLPHPAADAMLFRYPFKVGEVRGKPPNQKLGTVAVALLGWVAWAEASGDHSEDDNIRAMARFVKNRLLPNGKFDPYYVNRGHPYYGQENDIVPGEAALALGEVAEYFGEPEWLDFYPKYLDYYEPWFESKASRKVPTGRWPHGTYANQDRLDLVEFGPWSVMANKQAYRVTGDERAAAFGLEVADWMIDNYQWSEDRSPWPDYVGGYYKLPSELPAMQSFCYAEGTAAAYHLAATWKPEVKDKYDTATRETLRFLDVMQYDDVDSYFAAEPELIHGGIKYAMNEQKIRIDYVGHGLSTVSQYLDAREADPAVQLDLRIATVDYDPAVEATWGTWVLDTNRPPTGADMTDEQLAVWKQVAGKLVFEYSPDSLVERGLGRAIRVPYEVDSVKDGVVEIVMDPPGPATERRRTLWREGEELVVVDGLITQRFVRGARAEGVAAGGVVGDSEDTEEVGGEAEDEGGE